MIKVKAVTATYAIATGTSLGRGADIVKGAITGSAPKVNKLREITEQELEQCEWSLREPSSIRLKFKTCMLIKRKQGVNRRARQQGVAQSRELMAVMTVNARQNCILFHASVFISYSYSPLFETSSSCLELCSLLMKHNNLI